MDLINNLNIFNNMNDIYILPTLINEDYLKAYSPIPINYNYEDIRPFISVAEEIWIIPIIGRALYNELIEQVSKNEITPENSTLLVKIYQLEAITVLYEALPFIKSHISEVGITNGKSDNSDSISSIDFANLKNHLLTQIEVLKSVLKQFLETNKDCYPLYVSDVCTCDSDSTDINWIIDSALLHGEDLNNYKKLFNYYNIKKNRPNANIRLYSI